MNIPPPLRRAVLGGLGLAALQIGAMILPILTLPILTQRLGVLVFGQLMLAQTLALLVAMFIDAGFNTESQRRVSISTTAHQAHHLKDNLLWRGLWMVPITLLLFGVNALMHWVPASLLAWSCLQIVGTWLFPQWWFVARLQSLRMGLALFFGRLCSAVLVWLGVQDAQDVQWAAFALSCASVIAGLVLLPWSFGWLWRYRQHPQDPSHPPYFAFIRPMVLSAFFAQLSSSLPQVILGTWSSLQQVGWFSAADRLTRAAAHVSFFIEQQVMSLLGRQADVQTQDQQRKRLLQGFAVLLAIATLIGWLLAPILVDVLYGPQYQPTVFILQLLIVWLALFLWRRAWMLWTWALQGLVHAMGRMQWAEACCVALLLIVGGYAQGAQGAAYALVISELILLTLRTPIKPSGPARQ